VGGVREFSHDQLGQVIWGRLAGEEERVQRGHVAPGPSRTFFAGKAACPSPAASIIKLIHNVASSDDADPVACDRTGRKFLPDYGGVSLPAGVADPGRRRQE